MARILICDPVSPDAVAEMKAAGHDVVEKPGMTPEQLLETIPGFQAMVVRSATKVTRPVLEKAAGSLKLVIRGGVGMDNIDAAAAKEFGVEVQNTPAASSIAVAELAMAHLLACCRFLNRADRTCKEGKWEKKAFSKGIELWNSTLGLVGYGRIAREVAKRAMAFEMKVVFYDPYVCECSAPGARKVDLETLCRESDFISLHIPFSAETKHIIDEPQLAMMKKNVVIVNCARGGTINEKALQAALESGKVFAAGLDVFETEPPADPALIQNEKVVATPHIGAGTEGATTRVGGEVSRIVLEYFK
jgi:D-3-phosphoglycerate dehydrogenase / 2-oxoglutarate reductase